MKMMRTCFFFLLVILSIHHINAYDDDDDDDDDDPCVRLTAAFNYRGDVYLVSGNEYFHIDSAFTETDHGTLKDEFYAPKGEIDAALEYDGDLYFFQGREYYSYNYIYYFGSSGNGRDNSKWGDFFRLGLDAAATLGDTSYFFQGCEYVEGHGNPEIRSIEDLGLPCRVDAAWSQNGKMYVALENDVWVVDEKGQVTGPEKLSDLVTLTTASLCQGNLFAAKIRAEQSYERKHECTIIDAAVTYDDTVYLFNGYDYITLDDEGHEVDIADVIDWGGLPGNIDAGIHWVGDDESYFFQGDHYFKYSYFSTPFARSNSHWGPFFLQGIDAAGNHHGASYFFKGCEMMLLNDKDDEGNKVLHAPDLNLPCDVDAAFSREGTLYVIKRNQVWVWKTDDEKAEGPASLSTAVSMTSWTACPPEE